jgi:hypothetical protein
MSAGWTLVLLAVGTVIAAIIASWHRRVYTAELGTVSARWIAEHRATEARYTGR